MFPHITSKIPYLLSITQCKHIPWSTICSCITTCCSCWLCPFIISSFTICTSQCSCITPSIPQMSTSYFLTTPIHSYRLYIPCYCHPLIICYQMSSYTLTCLYSLLLCYICQWIFSSFGYKMITTSTLIIPTLCIPIITTSMIFMSR